MTIKFEPRDVWIGWFWDRRDDGLHHYVCIVPMLVIHWVRRPKRTSWVWCPNCRRDLNGDNESFVNDTDTVRYLCASCGYRSEFDFETPVPTFLGSWDDGNGTL